MTNKNEDEFICPLDGTVVRLSRRRVTSVVCAVILLVAGCNNTEKERLQLQQQQVELQRQQLDLEQQRQADAKRREADEKRRNAAEDKRLLIDKVANQTAAVLVQYEERVSGAKNSFSRAFGDPETSALPSTLHAELYEKIKAAVTYQTQNAPDLGIAAAVESAARKWGEDYIARRQKEVVGSGQ